VPKKKVAKKDVAKKEAPAPVAKKEGKKDAKKDSKKDAKKQQPKARSVSPVKSPEEKSDKEPSSSEYLSRNEYDSLHEVLSMADEFIIPDIFPKKKEARVSQNAEKQLTMV